MCEGNAVALTFEQVPRSLFATERHLFGDGGQKQKVLPPLTLPRRRWLRGSLGYWGGVGGLRPPFILFFLKGCLRIHIVKVGSEWGARKRGRIGTDESSDGRQWNDSETGGFTATLRCQVRKCRVAIYLKPWNSSTGGFLWKLSVFTPPDGLDFNWSCE